MPKSKATPEQKDSEAFVISKEIYLAFQPLERIAAQALQRVGKVKILYDDPEFKDL